MLRMSWMRPGSGGPPRAQWIEEKDPSATPPLHEVAPRRARTRAWRPSAGQVAVGGLLIFVALGLVACSGEDLQPSSSSNELQVAGESNAKVPGRDERVQCQPFAAIPVALGPGESPTRR
jgi:hypothetical protein